MTLRHNLGGRNTCIQERSLYQCPQCGRVCIEAPDGCFSCFAPEDPDSSKMLFNYHGTGTVQSMRRSQPKESAEK